MTPFLKFAVIGLSWLAAAHPAPKTPPRPKPIEPDLTNNDFRIEPPKAKVQLWVNDTPPVVKTPVLPPVINDQPVPQAPVLPPISNVAPLLFRPSYYKQCGPSGCVWRPSGGYYWVKTSAGTYLYGPSMQSVQAFGSPVNF